MTTNLKKPTTTRTAAPALASAPTKWTGNSYELTNIDGRSVTVTQRDDDSGFSVTFASPSGLATVVTHIRLSTWAAQSLSSLLSGYGIVPAKQFAMTMEMPVMASIKPAPKPARRKGKA